MRLSKTDFVHLVRLALQDVPSAFAQYLDEVVVEVQPMPDPQDCQAVGVDDPRDLLGLYHGTPLTERGVDYAEALPDRILLFQRNIERLCDTRAEVIQEVRKTVLHEIGHFFGLEEDELEGLGY